MASRATAALPGRIWPGPAPRTVSLSLYFCYQKLPVNPAELLNHHLFLDDLIWMIQIADCS
jgi:hypothetical protein